MSVCVYVCLLGLQTQGFVDGDNIESDVLSYWGGGNNMMCLVC